MRISITNAVLILLMVPAAASAQSSIPTGTILPAQLNTSLDSQKMKPGQKITARIMQDVPGTKLHAGAKVTGAVLKVENQQGQPAGITLRFDGVKLGHQTLYISTDLRALASMVEVEEAQTPSVGTDRGSPWAWMPRSLIGGEVAYGQGGPVVHGGDVVGTALFDGVLAPPKANLNRGCRGEIEGNDKPQAFWVFASDACGVYGLDDIRIAHAGCSSPLGEITLSSEGRLLVRSGSGILLRVNSDPQ